MSQKPSIGRIVCYRIGDPDPTRQQIIAATIASVDAESDEVTLFVFDPEFQQPYRLPMPVPFGDSQTPNTWFWPERV